MTKFTDEYRAETRKMFEAWKELTFALNDRSTECLIEVGLEHGLSPEDTYRLVELGQLAEVLFLDPNDVLLDTEGA